MTPVRFKLPRHHEASAQRFAAVILGAAVLTALIFALFGRVGFNPTDDGTLLSQSYRLLNGQVPHRDVVFARPMGSAFIHMIDYAVPLPLFEASRLVGTFEIVVYSFLFAWFIYRLSPSQWRFIHLLGASAATLVNAHAFFLTAWFTTDGLLFIGAGLVMLSSGLRTGRRGWVWTGMLALGAAPVMKQSFVLAPLIGVLWVWWHGRRRNELAGERGAVIAAAVFGAIPIILYLGVIGALGGLNEFFYQISRADPVWGSEFFDATHSSRSAAWTWSLIFLTGAFAVVLGRRSVRAGPTLNDPDRILALTLRVLFTGLILVVAVSGRLEFVGIWGVLLVWCLVAWIVASLPGGLDRTGLLVAAMAWMTALSWGVGTPNLLAGSVGLFLVHRAWRYHGPLGGPIARKVVTAATALAIALLGFRFYETRMNEPYLDRPSRELTSNLSVVSPRLGHIRTNPVTAQYLMEIADCIRKYPASRVAVLPDNPAIYPALGLWNPFPLDWMLAEEVADEEDRIVFAASALDRRGDYLVLFQTFTAFSLPTMSELPTAGPASTPFSYRGTSIGQDIYDALLGSRIECRSFVGRYAAG